jgi:hypothetical protein
MELMMRASRLGWTLAVIACLATGTAAAEDLIVYGRTVPIGEGSAPRSFGSSVNTKVIQVSQWQPVSTGVAWQQPLPGYLNLTATDALPVQLYAALELDPGVEVLQVCLRAFDMHPSEEVAMVLGAFESASAADPNPGFAALAAAGTGTAATPGYTLLCTPVSPPLKMRSSVDLNSNGQAHTAQYWVGVALPTGIGVAVGPAEVSWMRTVSPAPAVATFTDVPTTHPFFRFVEALAAAGVTAGCAPGQYCPGGVITRGEMAVFLSVALGLHWPN